MLRRTIARCIGSESENLFASVINDKKFLDHTLAIVGKREAAGEYKPAPLSREELDRFTTSAASAENLFNKRDGKKPGVIVGDDGRVEGSNMPDPTRYGDWEVNGRCYDF